MSQEDFIKRGIKFLQELENILAPVVLGVLLRGDLYYCNIARDESGSVVSIRLQ